MKILSKDEPSLKNLKILIDKCGGVYEFCEKTGISHGTIYNVLNKKRISGKIKKLSIDHCRKIYLAMKKNGIKIKVVDLNPDYQGIYFE